MTREQINHFLRNYKQTPLDITRDDLLWKYGGALLRLIDKTHCDRWLDFVNDNNNRECIESRGVDINIPPSLENNINLYWFMYFFSASDVGFMVDVEGATTPFDGTNYHDIPFPMAKEIRLMDHEKVYTPAPKGGGSWYDLFLIMNDLMWRGGRILDCAITNVELVTIHDDYKVIDFNWSS